MNLTEYGALIFTQAIVGLVSAPSTMYIALVTEEPTSASLASDLVEPVDATGYMRKSIATADWSLVDSITATIANDNEYTWTPAVDWDTIQYVVLCTDVGTDQVYCWTEIDPVTPLTGSPFRLESASLTISISGPVEREDL